MSAKVVLKFVLGGLAALYATAGVVQLVAKLASTDPGNAYGAGRLAASLVPVALGAAIALALIRSALRNLEDAAEERPNPAARREASGAGQSRARTLRVGPWRLTIERVVEEPAPPAPEPAPPPRQAFEPSAPPATVSFACEGCGTAYTRPKELAGRKARCRTCRAVFLIPAPKPSPAAPPTTPVGPPGMIAFDCPQCGTSYTRDAALAGRKVRCRSCRTVFAIPQPRPAPGPSSSPPARPPAVEAAGVERTIAGMPRSQFVRLVGVLLMVVPASVIPSIILQQRNRERFEASGPGTPPDVPPAAPPPPAGPPGGPGGPGAGWAPGMAFAPGVPWTDHVRPWASPLYRDRPDARWVVLFRGRDPGVWNTVSDGPTFARPVAQAPADAQFLRLRRLDTGESLIVATPRDRLDRRLDPREAPGPGFRWCGSNEIHWGSRHLGIGEGGLLSGGTPESHGPVVVQVEFVDGYLGSGFGHEGHGDETVQHYGWRGYRIAPTDFEIAVTADALPTADPPMPPRPADVAGRLPSTAR